MDGRKQVEAVLKSPPHDWSAVSLRDIAYAIKRRLNRYRSLARSGSQRTPSPHLTTVSDELKTLYKALASKWSERGVTKLETKIEEVETKFRNSSQNRFETEYLQALKSQRDQQRTSDGGVAKSRITKSYPKFTPTHSLDSEKIPLTRRFKHVARLDTAISVEFDDAHSHFVRWPVRPGVQPCLIELEQPNGTVRLADSVTVLPTGAPHTDLVDPIYAAYLQLIAHEYRNDIQSGQHDPAILSLAERRCSDPPFTCGAVSKIRQNIFGLTERLGLVHQLTPQLRQQIDDLVNTAASAAFWHPKHLETDRCRKSWSDAWAILARLEEWEREKPKWNVRVAQFCTDIGRPLSDPSKQKGALMKMTSSLREIVGLEPGSLSKVARLNDAEGTLLPVHHIVL